jgi:dolichol kinase
MALSAAGTLLEQISWGGLDNFSVPMGVAAMAYWLGA